MIFHPGILALLLGGGLSFLMLLYAAGLGIRIAVHWDRRSSSARQLTLERKTYLVATLMNYALGFGVVSLFLFLHTLEEIHHFFVGAMCATGSLNANPIGWLALGGKILLFFASGIWIIVNHLDQQAEDYPLVRLKYGLLALICPLAGADLVFTARYFIGLDPVVITSCCGALFTGGGSGVASVVAGIPPGPSAALLYGSAGMLLAVQALDLVRPAPLFRHLAGLSGLLFLAAGVAAIVSFVAPHIYELPFHHCPFDIVQREYGYVGYLIYTSLFAAALFGMASSVIQLLPEPPSLAEPRRRARRRYAIASIVSALLFLALASWPLVFGNLRFGAS